MRYLDVYYDYLKVLDKKRNDLGTYLAAKEETNSYKIIYYKEIKSKIYNGLLISDVVLMILAGIVYSFVKEYYDAKDMIYYLIFALIINMALLIAIFVFKIMIKKLKDKENSEEAKLLKAEYRKEVEKIYQICPFLIISNKYYYELKALDKEKRAEFYNQKVLELQKVINFDAKGQVNVETYKEYLEKWIIKNKE